MRMTVEMVQQSMSLENYANGMRDYEAGRIHNMREKKVRGLEQIECEYWGNRMYEVRISESRYGYIYGRCTCASSSYSGECRHIAAAAIAYAKGMEVSDSQTDRNMRRVLDAYLRRTQAECPQVPAVLTPALFFSYTPDYPMIGFRVGRERPYVVRNIGEFLANVHSGATVAYGKQLTLNHSLSQFDEMSQQLIQLMQAASDTQSDYDIATRTKDRICFRGETFARFFALYRNRELEGSQGPMQLLDGDPEITISLKKKKDAALVTLKGTENLGFFGDSYRLYALEGTKLYACSDAFRRQVYPLLEQRGKVPDGKAYTLKMALNDIPAFCACVLPQVIDLAAVEDPSGLLEKYSPEECTPCFYLDMEDGTLTLELRYRYRERELRWDASEKDWADIRRDMPAERRARTLVDRSFQCDGKDFYLNGDEDAAYTYLVDGLPQLRRAGEVYISGRLQNRQVKAATPSVGISVSDGLLTLKLDTGGFPPEELSELYQSLLRRKKYHRLKDGRFLALDGSGTEKMAEMAQMLQLTKKDLEKDTITMPAFRGLYLDGLLSGSEDVQVNRDRSFRQMIRQFRAVEESDYNLPESLENTMRAYQKTGYRWLKTLESCGFGGILADEMGLGKTLQTIAYLASVPYAQTRMPSLVVCPTSLIYNWADELKRFAPQLTVQLILGPAAQRKQLREAAGERDLWVTSYELLRQDIGDYAQRKFYCCVLDEGQHIKNQSTQVSKAVKRIDCRQRFVLTGTPIENRLSELWNLFDFLMPGYLFSQSAFR